MSEQTRNRVILIALVVGALLGAGVMIYAATRRSTAFRSVQSAV